jgi:hypothetical protein
VLVVALEVGPDGGADLFDVLVDAAVTICSFSVRMKRSATMNRVTLPSSTVGMTAPSAPHITFGASVMIEPSWSFAGHGGRRAAARPSIRAA